MGVLDNVIFLDKYVNDILQKIYTSQPLLKLLAIDDNNNPTAYPDIVTPSDLYTDNENRRISVVPFNIDIVDQQKSGLTINVGEANLDNRNVFYKDIKMRFFVTVPYLLWELNSNDNTSQQRPNAIIHYLLELFNRQHTLGIGKDWFYKLYPIYPTKTVGGYCLELLCKDFIGSH